MPVRNRRLDAEATENETAAFPAYVEPEVPCQACPNSPFHSPWWTQYVERVVDVGDVPMPGAEGKSAFLLQRRGYVRPLPLVITLDAWLNPQVGKSRSRRSRLPQSRSLGSLTAARRRSLVHRQVASRRRPPLAIPSREPDRPPQRHRSRWRSGVLASEHRFIAATRSA
jgi:hypothetical protein